MADVKDPKIAEGTSKHQIVQANLMIAYDKIRSKDDDLTWALLDYEVSRTASSVSRIERTEVQGLAK
jgi:hypothetical protein